MSELHEKTYASDQVEIIYFAKSTENNAIHLMIWYPRAYGVGVNIRNIKPWQFDALLEPLFLTRMMTSSNGNIFRVTGHLCREFTGPRWIPHTKASDVELWCLLWSAPE